MDGEYHQGFSRFLREDNMTLHRMALMLAEYVAVELLVFLVLLLRHGWSGLQYVSMYKNLMQGKNPILHSYY
jgi:succinate dehydrogenase hydrophobic anchor subunit